MTRISLCAVLLSFTACQNYNFEQVSPMTAAQTTSKQIVASQLKPNVMLLVDRSGSMLQPINPQNPLCDIGCGSIVHPCAVSCPTRMSEVKSTLSSFFEQSALVARFGLTVFPSNSECAPAKSAEVDLPLPTVDDNGTDPTLEATAQTIVARLNMISPMGGTPTGASIEFAGANSGLNDDSDFRDDFMVLVTDGIPNCNDANANSICSCGTQCNAAAVAACSCTLGNCSGRFCSQGCLDQDETVLQIKALRQRNIRTVVIGFGAEIASVTSSITLNAMAQAGGFARQCPQGTDAECGANSQCTPSTKLCTPSFYRTTDSTELGAAFKSISELLGPDACEYTLSTRPSDARYLAVIVNEQSIAASDTTYAFDADANKVTFKGPLCQQLKAATELNPVSVEFRTVEQL